MTIQFIGDVHAGKKFEAGVPLHRRGERERSILDQLRAEVMSGTGPVVQVGDIFDKTVVSNSVVWEVAQILREAAVKRPVAILRGNHDASRDSSRVSSFQILTELVRPYGVVVADEEPVSFHDHLLIPWSPWKNAEEMLDEWSPMVRAYRTVVGHWDVVMGDGNQLPAETLVRLGVTHAITGHDHNARELEMDGLKVTVTGSMQPYSHGEDPEGRIYVTLSAEKAGEALDADPEAFASKCLRVVGDWDREVPNCLQFQLARVAASEDVDLGEVQFQTFDLRNLYDQACAKTGLSTLKDTVFQKLEEERGSAA